MMLLISQYKDPPLHLPVKHILAYQHPNTCAGYVFVLVTYLFTNSSKKVCVINSVETPGFEASAWRIERN